MGVHNVRKQQEAGVKKVELGGLKEDKGQNMIAREKRKATRKTRRGER